MKKKILTFSLLIIGLFICTNKVSALELNSISQNIISSTPVLFTQPDSVAVKLDTSKVGCAIFGDDLIEFLKKILDYIKIIGVVLAVVLGIIDYTRAVFGSDDKSMGKANKNFSTRMIAVGALFLAPSLLNFLLTLFNIQNSGVSGTCGLS